MNHRNNKSWLQIIPTIAAIFAILGYTVFPQNSLIPDKKINLILPSEEASIKQTDTQISSSLNENEEYVTEAIIKPITSENSLSDDNFNASASITEESTTNETAIGLIKLSANEQSLLSQLFLAFKNGDKTLVANLLLKNQSSVESILCNTFKGNVAIFDGENVIYNPETIGMVIKSDDCAFYGSFKNGMPDGHCIGIRINREDSETDGLDYQFVDADWKKGKANGVGSTGWFSAGGSYTTELFNGNFIDDILSGTVKWTIEDIDNENDDYYVESIEITYDNNGVLDLTDWRQDITDSSIYYFDNTNDWRVRSNSDWITHGHNLCPWA